LGLFGSGGCAAPEPPESGANRLATRFRKRLRSRLARIEIQPRNGLDTENQLRYDPTK
jgi:hypothetical protein